MLVMKFGGTSMGSTAAIESVKKIVREKLNQENLIVVVSAMSGTTDLLIRCGKMAADGTEGWLELLQQMEQRHLETIKSIVPIQHQSHVLSFTKTYCNELEDILNGVSLLKELSDRTLDRIMSFGELMSSRIIAASFVMDGLPAVWKDARELIQTNTRYGAAEVDFVTTNLQINNYLLEGNTLTVIPGFIAREEGGTTTTLGRGGSDYTAAIIAGAVSASALEIWTDVTGMMTADPRWVANARTIPVISYKEAMELSHFGAKVIYPPTIQPVMHKNIPVWVKNTFDPQAHGTLIQSENLPTGETIRGLTSINKIALLSLEGSGMVGIPGFSKRLFEALASVRVNVILITQSSSEHSICVAIDASQATKAKTAIDDAFGYEIKIGSIEPIAIEEDLSVIALVGENMKSHPGISGKMFGTLGRNGVNVRAIAQGSSERNISAVISSLDVKKSLNVLHEEFFETSYKQINLFVAGTGNVGKRLLLQLQQQQEFLLKHLRLQVNIAGIINSRKMIVPEEGIMHADIDAAFAEGVTADIDQFVEQMIQKNLRNTVFADVTANEKVAGCYNKLLEKSIAVVACNKIAASSPYANYQNLKDLANTYNTRFLFETNVGAGLPVIGTLNDLRRSGDSITKIEAVLSGTLNYVFNYYDGSAPFAAVVKKAQDEGFTEPDPRLDLSGTDVMRKIMILARESGVTLEMEDISNVGFMPASCMTGSVEDFYNEMEVQESHFQALYKSANEKGNKLKFVASLVNGKASVGLLHIDPQHDFYHLYGKDNIVRFYTQRYPDQPLVIKGAGAGAEVTASGVFADIIRAIG
jgi:aspartokinase/homoserine dehydrogenase 1